MNNDEEVLKDIVAGGLIGVSLGALISKDKGDGMAIGGIIGAAIIATFKAYERAKKSNLPLVYEKDGVIYEEQNGKIKFLRKIEKLDGVIKSTYKLK